MGLKDAMAKLIEEMKLAQSSDEILKLVDKDTKAVQLTGAPREKYLKALEEIQGPTHVREKAMEFGDETFYHGTDKSPSIESFNPELSINKKNGGTGGRYGKGSYFSNDPALPSAYADKPGGAIIPVKLKLGNSLDPKKTPIPESLSKFNTNDSSSMDGLIREMIREQGPERTNEILKSAGYDSIYEKTFGEAKVPDANQVRSVNAAFDTRFAKSPLLLAGAGAMPTNINPLDALGKLVDSYREKQGQVADAITERVSQPFGGADERQKELMRLALDPVNLVEGPAGMGLSAIEMMSNRGK